ncbi:sulfotransferase family protein [Sphingomonas montanisoli]|uniref:Sulfotransferase n=1 Tax=Sphingomonas montanisoli TaxID=2606412 RepID=A0A5D9C8P1_9SPHN|nr:sulfotransferase [Sphingomonas montanisoli]TZG27726.1 sulfotransferase [Sphingomonas montanisoli]
MTWDPGARPAWVQHAIDGEGGPLYAISRQPLVVGDLLAEAELTTGLSDWGPDDFREPLDVFIAAIEAEANLHPAGRLRLRGEVIHALENRLRHYRHLAEYPAVFDERIVAPIIVTGSPRAGTSMMHELLALLPNMRAPVTWEYWWPTPFANHHGGRDPRIELANADVRLLAELSVSMDGIHTYGGLQLREDPSAMLPAFRADPLWTYSRVPSYDRWIQANGLRPGYEYHRQVLQILQHQARDGRTWVIKAPSHLGYLELMLELYPDARIVVCHRDPMAMISSVTSLIATLRWSSAEGVDFQEVARESMDQFGRNLDAVLDLRKRGVLTDDRCIDVTFDQFTGDQAGTVKRIAERFGIPFNAATEQALADHLAAKPRGRHGGHAHDVDALGMDIAAERARFAEYMTYFHVRPEEAGD